MVKMNKGRIKQLVLLSLSIGLIVGGIWLSSTNAYKFLKGYLLFKTGQVSTVEASPDSEIQESIKDSGRNDKASVLYPARPERGERIGELVIPKLEATLPIYHGTDEDDLERGVGHFAGSVLPGENDNSVLAGHRDTVFRKLGEVGVNDILIVKTSAGEFTYKVRKVRIVDEDDRTVIVPKPRATLTVSTCYPFDFVGAAPERYVLIAELKGKTNKSR
ncbi:class D sortase [Pseudalkalibacillus salsuginis]|uniref:class D sortase n=1 Tax=Pseudalkalibacillus salsuginis TaxID=2910972 RepID=UPI001F2BF9BF|nr:class D sortase [Pseudalkalibacillus salsuginis]MCF6411670.1 class D sortase [Pseudalkalibacillus salsuginis]